MRAALSRCKCWSGFGGQFLPGRRADALFLCDELLIDFGSLGHRVDATRTPSVESHPELTPNRAEFFYRAELDSVAQLEAGVHAYIGFYNYERIKLGL